MVGVNQTQTQRAGSPVDGAAPGARREPIDGDAANSRVSSCRVSSYVGASELIWVRGRVTCWGRPCGNLDLSIRTLNDAEQQDEVDWNWTDAAGRFELELTAGRYALCDEDGRVWGELQVSTWPAQQDFELGISPEAVRLAHL